MEAAAVLLDNPKFPVNVGSSLRACSIYNVRWLRWTGTRVTQRMSNTSRKASRLPREERFKDYAGVSWVNDDAALDEFIEWGYTPVAVEFGNSEPLPDFQHPARAVYVFGPEDGSIAPGILARCHRFVRIPGATRTPLNLAQAVNIVLYDRFVKSGVKEYAALA